MHPALESVAHRPWPVPAGPWVMVQVWHDLLFAHWPIAFESLRPLVPPQLPLDMFDGKCWVGVVPFWMSGVRGRGTPAIPGLSRFPELNVCTYVTYRDKPGVYFFSLDAGSRMAVWGARALYHLPYFYADMKVESVGDAIEYDSSRLVAQAEFRGRYGPIAPVERRPPGSLEHWLTERYCLYTVHRDTVYRGEIHHAPWQVQDASAKIGANSMASAADITLPDINPLLHFAKHQDVLIWPLERA
jgi:uncharacterized protein YqjF (DUF2071 family)